MKDLLSIQYISTGFVSILVGYSSAAVIVYQAASAAGASTDQIGSWLWALGMGLGLGGIVLSAFFKQPVVLAWSTPGAALLVTSLPGVGLAEAIGAFMVSSVLILICGLTGWFDRIMALVPKSLAAAMLAGILLRFGLGIFPAFQADIWPVAVMIVVYLLGKMRRSSYTVPVTFLSGIVVAYAMGNLDLSSVSLNLTSPIWVSPTFDVSVMIGVSLPLFIVTMASQNVPGIAVFRAHGYSAPASVVISTTGAMGVLLAPFGGFAYNYAAITAAICMGEDVDPNPAKRYFAAIWAGVFYVLAGVFGMTVAGMLSAFPASIISVIAGLALLGTIGTSLAEAVKDIEKREAALFTFVLTASSGNILGIGAPFWALLVGLAVYHLTAKSAAR